MKKQKEKLDFTDDDLLAESKAMKILLKGQLWTWMTSNRSIQMKTNENLFLICGIRHML
jgi:hypothetical protein